MSRNCLPITLVEKHNEKTNVQKARRIPGTILSTGTFLLGPTLRECALGKRGEEDRALAPTLDCLIQGLRYLETYQDTPAVRFPLQSAQGQAQVQIVWMRDHDVLADCMTDENGMLLRLDTGWVDALRKVESKDEQTGLTVLGAVVDLYILVVLGGAEI
ncbi:MAG: hypothetical protein RBU29_09085, partial [bacterium]|nr:hypothetical protein [bacterium]